MTQSDHLLPWRKSPHIALAAFEIQISRGPRIRGASKS